MTILEQALATIIASIESARASANTQALAALLARKEAICAALAAPEQCWHDPCAHASDTFVQRKAAKHMPSCVASAWAPHLTLQLEPSR